MASMSSISKYSESLSKITECVYDITLNRTLMLGRWLEFHDRTGEGERQIWRNHIVRHIMCMSFCHFIDILQTRVSKTSEKFSTIRFTHVTHSVEFLARGKWISYRFWYKTFQNCLMIMMSISLKIGKMWCLFSLTVFNGCARYEICRDRKYFRNLWHFMVGKILAELAFLVLRQF